MDDQVELLPLVVTKYCPELGNKHEFDRTGERFDCTCGCGAELHVYRGIHPPKMTMAMRALTWVPRRFKRIKCSPAFFVWVAMVTGMPMCSGALTIHSGTPRDDADWWKTGK